MRIRRALFVVAALGGVLAAVAGSPYRAADDTVSALRLAEWIRDRRPGLRILDLRPADEYAMHHLPRAERTTGEPIPIVEGATLVLHGPGDSEAAARLRAQGHRSVYRLEGGMDAWMDDVLSPTIRADATPEEIAAFRRVSELSRYFGGVPRVVDPTIEPKAAPRPRGKRGC